MELGVKMSAATQSLSWAAHVTSAGHGHKGTQLDCETVISSCVRVPLLRFSRFSVSVVATKSTNAVTVMVAPMAKKQQVTHNKGVDMKTAKPPARKRSRTSKKEKEAPMKPEANIHPNKLADMDGEEKSSLAAEFDPPISNVKITRRYQKKVLEAEFLNFFSKEDNRTMPTPVVPVQSKKTGSRAADQGGKLLKKQTTLATAVKRQPPSRSKISQKQELEKKVESPRVATTKRATSTAGHGKQRISIPDSKKVETKVRIEGESGVNSTGERTCGVEKIEKNEQVFQDDSEEKTMRNRPSTSTLNGSLDVIDANFEGSSDFEKYLDSLRLHICKIIRDDLPPRPTKECNAEGEVEDIDMEEDVTREESDVEQAPKVDLEELQVDVVKEIDLEEEGEETDVTEEETDVTEEEIEEINLENETDSEHIDVHVEEGAQEFVVEEKADSEEDRSQASWEHGSYGMRKRLVQVGLHEYISSMNGEDFNYPTMEDPLRTTGRDMWVRPAGSDVRVNPPHIARVNINSGGRDVWVNPTASKHNGAVALAAAGHGTTPKRCIISSDPDIVVAGSGESSDSASGRPTFPLRRFRVLGNAGQRREASCDSVPIRRRRIMSPSMPEATKRAPATFTEERDRLGRRYPKAYYDKKGATPHHIPQMTRWPNLLHPVQLRHDDHGRNIWKRGDVHNSSKASGAGAPRAMDRREIVTIIVIGGPTVVGKSALGIALANKLGGEIISADSVQVYRGLDVGSAKSTMEEREGIPHHLLDIAFPDAASSYNGKSQFAVHAWQAVRAVVAKGKTPIVVGGSRMYTRWFIEAGASVWNNGGGGPNQVEYRVLCYTLWKPYDMVYERIDERCEEMVVQGILEEASWLLDMGVRPSTSSASRAIGYRQAMRFLEESRAIDGATSRSRFLAFLTLVQETSREFARNQLAVFGGDARFQNLNGMRPTEEILRVVEADVLTALGGQPTDVSAELQQLERLVKAPWKGQGGEYAEFYETKLRIFSDLEKCDKVIKWVKRTQRKVRGRMQRFQGSHRRPGSLGSDDGWL